LMDGERPAWTVGADGIRRLADGTPIPTPAPDGFGFLVPPEFHEFLLGFLAPPDEPYIREGHA
jgi:hypothetical protein